MNALFSKKPICIAIGISFLITLATYLVQLSTVTFGGFIPLTMQYTVISSTASSTSTPAMLYGWPFAWILANVNVMIFSLLAFIIDWIIFIVLSFLVLWLLLRNDSVGEYMKPKARETNKVARK